MLIVYCEVYYWDRGTGWEHYYGWITCGSKRVELEDKITQSEADRFNRRTVLPAKAKYKAGEKIGKFFSEDRLKAAAIAQYKTIFPGATTLIHGDDVDPDPQPIWDGPYQKEVEALMIEMGIYRDKPHVIDDIRTDWKDILEELGG